MNASHLIHHDNMNIVHHIRYILFKYFYSNPVYIEQLNQIINKNIDCLSVEYDNLNYTFTIKIKKTSMRKIRGFSHDPIFYYHLLPGIFKEFINNNISLIEYYLTERVSNDKTTINHCMNNLYSDIYCLNNICGISCLGDNILLIKL